MVDGLHELLCCSDLERLYELRDALVRRGLEAEVWGSVGGGVRLFGQPSRRPPRLVVYERDVVYARWILAAAGVDVWPEPAPGDELPSHVVA